MGAKEGLGKGLVIFRPWENPPKVERISKLEEGSNQVVPVQQEAVEFS